MSERHTADLQPAWILHQRPWRDSSSLLELLSRDHGRVGLIGRGLRSARSLKRGTLQAFHPLLCSWTMRGELGTLTAHEAAGAGLGLRGERLYCGLYLNELLLRLLPRDDADSDLFDAYVQAMRGLSSEQAVEITLRRFECQLLDALGYALPLAFEAGSGEAVVPQGWYRWAPQSGPQRIANQASDPAAIDGASLLALETGNFINDQQARQLGRLTRQALSGLLGARPLQSRALLLAHRRQLQRAAEPK